jgi:hypothetical protein
MFDLFAHHRLPDDEEVRQVDFITMNPAVSSRYHWSRIMSQEHTCIPSEIHILKDPAVRRFKGTTANVARLEISLGDLATGDRPIRFEIDGDRLDVRPTGEATVLLERRYGDGGRWLAIRDLSVPANKSPYRGGPFKQAFDKGFVLVYATAGSKEENEWAFAKARFDAESWYYRGNGAVDILSDREYVALKENVRHNVILYGNADTNSAWPALFPTHCPIRLSRGAAMIGGHSEHGDDVACLFTYPAKGSRVHSVGVVGGTGLAGMRLTDRLPYFVSGVAYPDIILIGPEMLEKGTSGVRAAGFFGNDWLPEHGDIAWRHTPEDVKR